MEKLFPELSQHSREDWRTVIFIGAFIGPALVAGSIAGGKYIAIGDRAADKTQILACAGAIDQLNPNPKITLSVKLQDLNKRTRNECDIDQLLSDHNIVSENKFGVSIQSGNSVTVNLPNSASLRAKASDVNADKTEPFGYVMGAFGGMLAGFALLAFVARDNYRGDSFRNFIYS